MKNKFFSFIVVLVAFFATQGAFANNCTSENFFTCDEINADKEFFSNIASPTSKEQALEILQYHPLAEDGTLKYSYIIRASENFDIDEQMSAAETWAKSMIRDPRRATIDKDADKHVINVYYNAVAAMSTKVTKAVVIWSTMQIKISFKDNRMKFEISYPGYKATTGKAFKGPEAKSFAFTEVYPAADNNEESTLFAEAFGKCNTVSCEYAVSYLKFLNDHATPEEDW